VSAVLHTRLSQIAANAAALDECAAYIEREIRPVLEARPGSLGISLLEDRERGMAIFGSIWATSYEMSGSEDTEAPLRAELARQAGRPVTVADYQIPVYELFEQTAAPVRGHAVRLTRIRVRPSQVDDAIEVVGDIAVPSLTEMPGFCDALLFAQPASGNLISETVWRDQGARAAAPSVAAIVRAELPDEAGSEIRAVEDYALIFSTVREP
jgi:Antibiotic biosynthesis monooxygenase